MSAGQQDALRTRLLEGIERLDLRASPVPPPQLAEMAARLLNQLRRWSRVHSLVAPGNPQQWAALHVLDSLALVPHLDAELRRQHPSSRTGQTTATAPDADTASPAPRTGQTAAPAPDEAPAGSRDATTGKPAAPGPADPAPIDKTAGGGPAGTAAAAHWLDVGSGAGFPGLVLAMALPQWRGTLLDSRLRPCAFMRQAVMELGLTNAEVRRGRVERLAEDSGGQRWPVLLARALAEPATLLPLLRHLLAERGRVLLPTGPTVAADQPQAPAGWRWAARIRLEVPFLDAARWLLIAEPCR